ncbi:MAG TPA: Gfo/Idh/MocA family oxidoreductase [Dongiaceae bacterium]
MPDKMRLSIAGTGTFGREHLSALAGIGGVEIAGIADIDAARAQETAARFSAARWETDAARLIEQARPDGLIVATPGPAHLALAVHALALDIPVLVEKPVGMSAAEGARLLEAEGRSHGFVLPGHVSRFSAPHRQIREIVQSGEIGDLLSLKARRYRDEQHAVRFPDVDPVLMTMIHDIDLALWITGRPIAEITARRFPRDHPRSMTEALGTSDGGPAWQLATAWTYPVDGYPPDRLEIVGSKGGVELETGGFLRQYGAKARQIDLRGAPDTALREELVHFVECIREKQAPRIVTCHEAWIGLVVADAICESLRRQGAVRLPELLGEVIASR